MIQKTRSHYLRKRAQLSPFFCAESSESICHHLSQLPLFQHSQHIAFYIGFKNEVSLSSLLEISVNLGKKCYLPAINAAQGTLEFRHYIPTEPLEKNSFGIFEPNGHQPCLSPQELDLVFTPLVAWDHQGHRLGMGAGYYDKTFAFKKNNVVSPPYLIGIAYECQQHPQLEMKPWDVSLNAVMTEKNFYPFCISKI